MKFHDVSKDPRVLTEMSDQEALFEAQAREATAKLCWEPYFHNPSLRYRLNRVTVKTLVMWGAQDGFVKPAYGRAYAKRMPNAKFVSIPKAGHFPHIEQPDAFMKELRAFLR
jgi:pimeloyl-ACP methyl ester carboxylesterase